MLIEYRSTSGRALELATNGRLMPVPEMRIEDICRNLEARGCPAEMVERMRVARLRNADPATLTFEQLKERAAAIGAEIAKDAAATKDTHTEAAREAARWLGANH
jgi:hypothetical protein